MTHLPRTTATVLVVLALGVAGCSSGATTDVDPTTSAATSSATSPNGPSTAPTDTRTPGDDAPRVDDDWVTSAGEGFEISHPPDWEPTTERGDQALNVEGPGPSPSPLVGVTAQPSSSADAVSLLGIFSGAIADSVEDFTEVEVVALDLAGADEAVRAEVTYTPPRTPDRVVHEYLVIAVGDGVDVAVRAATLDEQWDEVAPVLAEIIATVRLVPASLDVSSTRPSPSPS